MRRFNLIVCAVFFVITHNSPCQNKEIITSIETFFKGMSIGDTSLMNSICNANLTLTTVHDNADKRNLSSLSKKDFFRMVATPRKEKIAEKIIHYSIQADGNLANAWCTYVLYADTSFIHWGVDNFVLYKDNDTWKILSITDTRKPRTTFVNSYTEHKTNINSTLDKWHRAAATGDENVFFTTMDSTCIYLGTDKTEHWDKKTFEEWSKKYFEKDKAWDFKPYNRHIYFSTDSTYAWFDELLDTWMGVCRGSGVLHMENNTYKLLHYNLAVTVPNEKMKTFVELNR